MILTVTYLGYGDGIIPGYLLYWSVASLPPMFIYTCTELKLLCSLFHTPPTSIASPQMKAWILFCLLSITCIRAFELYKIQKIADYLSSLQHHLRVLRLPVVFHRKMEMTVFSTNPVSNKQLSSALEPGIPAKIVSCKTHLQVSFIKLSCPLPDIRAITHAYNSV